jgi:hypothetical protein
MQPSDQPTAAGASQPWRRRQLYDLVWLKPMRDAAAELGMSDVGLKKLCLRHRVPVPPQGYWNRVNAGHRPRKRAFRELEGSKFNRIFVGSTGRGHSAEVRKAMLEARARENEPARKVEVPSDMRPTLSAVVRLEATLKRCKPDQDGFVSVRGPALFRVRRVRPEDVGRVVSIVQALLAGAVARGLNPKAGEEDLTLVVEGWAIVPSLRGWSERKRTRRVYSAPDPPGQPRQRWRYEYEPTGRLSLQIDDEHLGNYARRRWQDTADLKLEAMLSDVIAGLVVYVAARKQQLQEHRRDAELQAQERQRAAELQEQQRQRDEKSRELAERERGRVDFLDQRLRELDEMQRLERFLSLLDAFAPRAEAPSPRCQAFIQWAKLRLEHLRQACSVQTLETLLANNPLFADRS